MKKNQKVKRKQISLKNPEKVTPIQEVEETSKSQSVAAKKKQKIKFTSYPTQQIQITVDEISQINKVADSLVTLQLMKVCFEKQEDRLKDFYKNNHEQMKKVFKLLHSKISELFKKIKENGLEGLDDDVEFIPPDCDVYETYIGQKISEILRDNYEKYEKKKNFKKISSQYEDEIQLVSEKISEVSKKIEREEVEKQISYIENRILSENERESEKKITEIRNNIKLSLSVFDKQRIIRRRKRQNLEINEERRQIEAKKSYFRKWNESPSLLMGGDLFA